LDTPEINKKIPILIYINKSDLSSCIKVLELKEKFSIDSIPNENYLVESSAINGKGIDDGVRWLLTKIKKKE
jgi:signal recognition particle receptor subunit beta